MKSRGGGGEGDSDIKGARMLVEKFEVKPERRPIWAWPSMSKYNGVLFSAPYRTEEVRPKSEIYSPKRDDEHPRPFHMGHLASPSPPPPPPGIKFLLTISIPVGTGSCEW